MLSTQSYYLRKIIIITLNLSSNWKRWYIINLISPQLLNLKRKQKSTKLKAFPGSQGQVKEGNVCVAGFCGISFGRIQAGREVIVAEKKQVGKSLIHQGTGRKKAACCPGRRVRVTSSPGPHSPGNCGKLPYFNELSILLYKIIHGQLVTKLRGHHCGSDSFSQTICV